MPVKENLGSRRPNNLIHERSPYLRQHATNPVNWYPWGEEAFRRAREEDKPLFLSIGYATCHWCHVMAHESFEDDGVARVLNDHFIAIKVDREERPDIDGVYMEVCQQMTGQGGWPLTVILTPEKEPFFAGTYFPRNTRGRMIGLVDLLTRIAGLWEQQRNELKISAGRITAALRDQTHSLQKGSWDISLLNRGYKELSASFDPVNGGFGIAPKFPTPSTLFFLLRYWKRTGSAHALQMTEKTLDAMARGGIFDHVGGGFHRYATDAAWRVPHFEKMLYDQALLMRVFTETWLATKKPIYRDIARSITGFALDNLQDPGGGFISAIDADSPAGEGAYYTWTRDQLDTALGPEDGARAAELFGVTPEGNFSIPETGQKTSILFLSERFTNSMVDESLRARLLSARNQRPPPIRDEKILTDWNALFITALARAYRAFGDPHYGTAAQKALAFLESHLRVQDGGLYHRYCDGEAAIPAFADDYAFTIQAYLALYEATFNPAYLENAITLTRYMDMHFAGSGPGGYFVSPDNGDPLIVRKKEIYDGALPSANSVMLENLVVLHHLTGESGYGEQAAALADTFAGTASRKPSAYSAYLAGVDLLLGPVTDVVIAGDPQDARTSKMIKTLAHEYLPSVIVTGRFPENAARLDMVAPFTRDMAIREGKVTAYVCQGRTCSEPVNRPEELLLRVTKKV